MGNLATFSEVASHDSDENCREGRCRRTACRHNRSLNADPDVVTGINRAAADTTHHLLERMASNCRRRVALALGLFVPNLTRSPIILLGHGHCSEGE